jgi:hypothetical protein
LSLRLACRAASFAFRAACRSANVPYFLRSSVRRSRETPTRFGACAPTGPATISNCIVVGKPSCQRVSCSKSLCVHLPDEPSIRASTCRQKTSASRSLRKPSYFFFSISLCNSSIRVSLSQRRWTREDPAVRLFRSSSDPSSGAVGLRPVFPSPTNFG